MRRLTMNFSVLVVLVCAAWCTAGQPPVPIDRPTPPPCAADGICYPNINEWGYYPGRWRRWPGHELVPTPAEPAPADRLGPDLAPYEVPSPEKEDERAPPASTKRETTAPAGEPSGDASAPEGLDTPTSPSYPSPLSQPAEPTTDLDPPPAPPFAMSPATRPLATPLRAPTNRRPRAAGTASTTDPPPAMPWTSHSASL